MRNLHAPLNVVNKFGLVVSFMLWPHYRQRKNFTVKGSVQAWVLQSCICADISVYICEIREFFPPTLFVLDRAFITVWRSELLWGPSRQHMGPMTSPAPDSHPQTPLLCRIIWIFRQGNIVVILYETSIHVNIVENFFLWIDTLYREMYHFSCQDYI